MSSSNSSQADYYREQASRVRKRAELEHIKQSREALLELALRWEKLATEAEPARPVIRLGRPRKLQLH